MALVVTTLNVGRMLQKRTRSFLEGLIHPGVLLLQDFPYRDLPLLEKWPHVTFAPMTRHLINGERATVGIAIASRYFMTDISHFTVWGDGTLKKLEGINERNERHLGTQSDQLVEATEDRVLICACVHKDGVEYQLATTHGMWARGGQINDVQRATMRKTHAVLRRESLRRPGLVLGGDLNFPRDGELYMLFAESFRDCLPRQIQGTLDPDHPLSRKGVNLVVDYFWHCGIPYEVEVSDVYTTGGASDHCALSATIRRA